jgi:hypothetical protein
MAPIKTLFGNHGVNHAHGVVEAWQVCDTNRCGLFECAPTSLLDFLVVV